MRIIAHILVLTFCAIYMQPLRALADSSVRDKILNGEPVQFDKNAPEDARTVEAELIKAAIQQNKKVLIIGAVIHGSLDLRYATIEQEVEFDNCKFDSPVDLSHAIVKRSFGANRTVFTHGGTFESASFATDTYFGGSTFAGPTVFQNVRVQGRFILTTARFTVRNEEQPNVPNSVSFHHAQFLNLAAFGATTFEGRVFFDDSHFGDQADFGQVSFQQVGFDFSHFDQECHFESTEFGGPLSFREATFHTVFFSSSGAVNLRTGQDLQFNDTVDLRGWTYTGLRGNWKSLFLKPSGEFRFLAYDRQPFTQLEGTYRKEGRDEAADTVYLTRRTVERKLKWSTSRSRWITDVFFWSVNYGIDSIYRLAIVSLVLLCWGTFYFSQANAIQNEKVRRFEAFLISLRWFLPLDIPLRANETIGDRPLKLLPFLPYPRIRPDTFATFVLRLWGYIIVPFSILAVSGYLRYVG